MIDELVSKVWANPRFHILSKQIEKAWLARELSLDTDIIRDELEAFRLSKAACILACSEDNIHRLAAYRVATQTFDLYENSKYPHDRVLRLTLARLGNLPSIQTRTAVAEALPGLPWSLAAEEINTTLSQTITVGTNPIILTPFQLKLWSKLANGERIALSAPTSAGKSFVLQTYVQQKLSGLSELTVLYLVPTRALITQVSGDFEVVFRNLEKNVPEIITVPFDESVKTPKKAIYVLTQERAQLMTQAHPGFSPDIIIVDEAHSVGEGARGVLLQWVIDDLMSRNPRCQILFASPTIRNLDVFGKLFGMTDVVAVRSTEPTVAQNFVKIDVESARKGIITIATFGDGKQDLISVGRISLDHTLASRKDKLVHIPLLLEGSGSSIIYANGAAEAEDIALQIAERLEDRLTTAQQQQLTDLAKEAVHEKFVLAQCLSKGVAFHYSNIPTALRVSIERGFKNGDIDFLSCTSTLLQGVNLPAKHIFMCKPEKGRLNPLDSTDFWNLAGRAGRPRKEFQGNIFLIDYEKWSKQPLSGPKDAEVTPAISTSVVDQTTDLIGLINDREGTIVHRNRTYLDSCFVRLLSDFRDGRINETLSRCGITEDSTSSVQIRESIQKASLNITIPNEVIKRSGNISPHRQESLYQYFLREITVGGRETAVKLMPAHPREPDAFASFEKILELCYSKLLGAPSSSRVHKFHALMALRWMQGWPLPRIIQSQIDRNPEKAVRKVIRDTLNVIESSVRFGASRAFACYNGILTFALDQIGFIDLASALPSIPLFLEVGASDQTMVSFISLGLSRAVAAKLNDISSDKNLTPQLAKQWLVSREPSSLGLSPLLLEEIYLLLSGAQRASL